MTSSSCSISNSSEASRPMWEKRAWGPPGWSLTHDVRSMTMPLTATQRSSFLLCLAASSSEYSVFGTLNFFASLDPELAGEEESEVDGEEAPAEALEML